jgi:Phage tail sheath protein subtilisin-like domain/Phage tail sheath C-terminal domain
MTFTTMDKGRPGVWVNFTEAAASSVEGSDGVVAIVKKKYNATAEPGTIYEFTGDGEAKAIIGVSNLADITRAFQGGASKVIVYTQPAESVDYSDAQQQFELQFFEALTFDHALTAGEVADWKAWLKTQEENENRHEMFYGAATDEDVAAGIARSVVDKSETVTNIINAPVVGGATLSSMEIAPFVAGAWASTPLSGSITYLEVPDATDVNVRLSAAQVREALAAGAIVFEYTGRNVRVVRGVTTAGTSLKRTAVKHTAAREWKFLIENKYIGKVPNGPNQRLSMRADLNEFLRLWESQGIIEADTWNVQVEQGPASQQVVVNAFMRDLESMEEIYITIGLGA